MTDALIKTECGRRIKAVASIESQINMVAASATMVPAMTTIHRLGLDWIADMRSAAIDLIRDQDPKYQSDDKWPAPPPEFVAIVKLF